MSRRQLPRGTAAQLDAATFLPGEIAVDTTNDELRYDGDGSTVGGIALARKDGTNISVTATGSTEGRSLADRFGDILSVKDFGDEPNGVTNNAATFTAAEVGADKLVFIPRDSWVVSTAVTTTTSAWLQDPTQGLLANLDMRRGLYCDRNDGSNVWRFADKVYIDAATLNGGNYHNDGSWLTSVIGAGYIERASSLVAINSYGGPGATFATRASDRYGGNTVWAASQSITAGQRRGYSNRLYEATNSGTTGAPGPTHSSGTVADGGGVSWLHIEAEGVVTAAYMSFMLNNTTPDGYDRYGAYSESVRDTMAGTTIGKEINVKNKAGNVLVNPFIPFGNGGGATIGYYFAGGGDSAYYGAAANPSSAAILIGKNTHTWNTGILFEADSITGNDGVTGSGEAISMAKGHEINWYRTNGGVGARTTRIKSSIATANQGIGLEFSDNIMWCISLDDNSKVFFQARRVASAVNFVETLASATGSPVAIQAAGDDTNVDLTLAPKGTGVLRTARPHWILSGTATPAGGTALTGLRIGSANMGVFFGSGAPSLSAAKGSLYLRSDGSTTNDRMYVNTDGGTTWTAVITAA